MSCLAQTPAPYIKKILILGEECTGKSTLTLALAKHYRTTYACEFMRPYLIQKPMGYVCTWNDLLPIAKGQIHGENQAVHMANRYCFVDTAALLLEIYSHWYFGDCPPPIAQMARQHRYDLVLLTDDVGIPWQADGMRDLPNDRHVMHQRIIDTLDHHHIAYHPISGSLPTRLETAHALMAKLLG